MKTSIFLFLFSICQVAFGQSATPFTGIKLKDSLVDIAPLIQKSAANYQLISVEPPIFPLAAENETHIVCNGFRTEAGILDNIVFTFADQQLVYVEASGNAYELLSKEHAEAPSVYMSYEVYASEMLFLNQSLDRAWILTEEAMHANLFTWKNPYVTNPSYVQNNQVISQTIPEFLTMGASIEEMSPKMKAHSTFTATESLDGSDPNAQLQWNCFGVDYLGFPRKVEARFGDEKLNVVWILTGKGEEDRIRKALTAQFGNPIFVNNDWEIFNNWQVGLRKDKPEVLLMTEELGNMYKTSYFKQ